MSRSHRVNGREELSSVISSNNIQFDNSNSNTHNSNMSHNFEGNLDSLNNQYQSSVTSKQDPFDKTRTTNRKQTDSSSNIGKSKLLKRPSANS